MSVGRQIRRVGVGGGLHIVFIKHAALKLSIILSICQVWGGGTTHCILSFMVLKGTDLI